MGNVRANIRKMRQKYKEFKAEQKVKRMQADSERISDLKYRAAKMEEEATAVRKIRKADKTLNPPVKHKKDSGDFFGGDLTGTGMLFGGAPRRKKKKSRDMFDF